MAPENKPNSLNGKTSSAITDPIEISQALAVGNEVQVQKEMTSERHWASFVGWRAGEYLILDGPAQLLQRGLLFKGNSVALRYLHLGSMYGCASRVLAVHREPTLMVLDWPESLERVSIAAETRTILNIMIYLTLLRGGEPVLNTRATLRDISASGCKLLLTLDQNIKGQFVKDDLVVLELTLPGDQKPSAIKSEVKNIMEHGSQMVLGTHFMDDQKEILDRLQKVIGQQLASQPQA